MTLRRAAADLDADVHPRHGGRRTPRARRRVGRFVQRRRAQTRDRLDDAADHRPRARRARGHLGDGRATDVGASDPIGPADPVKVHFFCEDTGLFDGGPHDDGLATPIRVACPNSSQVSAHLGFSVGAFNQALAALPCQQGFVAGTTAGPNRLARHLRKTRSTRGRQQVVRRRARPGGRSCADTSQYYRSADQFRLAGGQELLPASTPQAVALPLRTEVSERVFYKTSSAARECQWASPANLRAEF